MAGFLSAGCGSSGSGYVFTKSTLAAVPARPAGCDFQILGSVPSRPHEEIGILDGTHSCPDSVQKFRAVVGQQVCAAGGDAVITEVSGFGCYVRGIVVRWK
jgi:hypothetical protein